MTSRKLPSYSLEFKQSSAKLAAESDQPIAQTAKELGVNPNTLYCWVGKYAKKSAKKSGPDDDLQLELLCFYSAIVIQKSAKCFCGFSKLRGAFL